SANSSLGTNCCHSSSAAASTRCLRMNHLSAARIRLGIGRINSLLEWLQPYALDGFNKALVVSLAQLEIDADQGLDHIGYLITGESTTDNPADRGSTPRTGRASCR